MAASNLLILCYHAVSEDWSSAGAIDPGVLDRQIRYLLRRRYQPVTLSAALGGAHHRRMVVVTFDDAFHSVVERGLPVLERHGVPATLFVPTDFATEAAPMTWSTLAQWVSSAHERELRCMSWDDVRRLAAAGWEIGSHTCSHPDLTAIDGGAAAAELRRSREACESELQCACPSLAYPFGAYDQAVVELAEGAGYEHAVTLGNRLIEPRSRRFPLELSREGVYRTTGWPSFMSIASPAIGRVRGWGVYRRLYQA